MWLPLLVGFLFQLSVIAQPPDQDFDCQVRAFAYEYAQYIQPQLTTLQLADIYDALELGTLCNQTEAAKRIIRPKPEISSWRPRKKQFTASASAIYVDAVNGNDSNPGTIDQPLKTLAQGVALSRFQNVKTIILRAGTYYLQDTINLYTQDSGLTIQNYQNEVAELSGAQILTIPSWKPYNVSGPFWDVETNQNAVYGETPDGVNVAIYGKTNSAQDCQNACIANKSCNVFTWHDDQQGQYSLQCWFRFDNKWNLVAESGHTSGHQISINIYVADINGQVENVPGLRVNGGRGTRARYPNGNSELTFFPNGWIPTSEAKYLPPNNTGLATTEIVQSPTRDWQTMFQQYRVGMEGPCWQFSPTESYWCAQGCEGGGASIYVLPSGLQYTSNTFEGRVWSHPEDGIISVWRDSYWELWFFQIGQYFANNQTIIFGPGGFQGARGNENGADWYVENLFEELDYPNEYFYDKYSGLLYYFYNGTGSPPTSTVFESTRLKSLISVVGTQTEPIQNITLRGLKFSNTAYTYMDPHGVPSGGDWALERSAAVFFEGVEGITVEDCYFTRIDGNALFLSGYIRNATVTDNEFVWIGDTCVASWGYTDGIDGTNGEQPRGTVVANNVIHEMGIYEKQASPYFQAKTCQTLLNNNIMYNGPRAGINFNDGFGGDNLISENLLWNFCRESSDHAAFNSWDRQPFLTEIRNGTPSLMMAYNTIFSNFFFGNDQSSMAIDTDDGSSFYKFTNNFEVYGGHKSNFGGNNKISFNNINAYSKVYSSGLCLSIESGDEVTAGNQDTYNNNKCVQGVDAPWAQLTYCDPKSPTGPEPLPNANNNEIYTPSGSAYVQCGPTNFQMSDWPYFPNTTVYSLPSHETIIDWARALLMPSTTK